MSAEQSEGLESFVAIYEHGSIAAAARALDMPRETLSRRLSRLEQRLGVRLVHRTTRALSLTHQGKAMYAHARRAVDAAEDALRAVRQVDDVPRGVLRVSVPPAGSVFLAAMFEGFLARWPEVDLEVISTTRYVDLRAEGVDVALRGGTTTDGSLIARRLWRAEMIAVASTAYARARGLPDTLEELADHECVYSARAGAPTGRWPTRTGDSVLVRGRMATNDQALQMALVRRGLAIAMTLRPFVQRELDSGELVSVLPDVLGAHTGMSAIFTDRELMQPKVRAFIDHMAAWFSDAAVAVIVGEGA